MLRRKSDATTTQINICLFAGSRTHRQRLKTYYHSPSSVVCATEGASDIYIGKIVCKMRRILVSEIDLFKIQDREDRAIEQKSVVATCLS